MRSLSSDTIIINHSQSPWIPPSVHHCHWLGDSLARNWLMTRWRCGFMRCALPLSRDQPQAGKYFTFTHTIFRAESGKIQIKYAEHYETIRETTEHPVPRYIHHEYTNRLHYAVRGPKSPWTSNRMRRAFRARTFDSSSGCEVKLVSTSLGSSLNGYYRASN